MSTSASSSSFLTDAILQSEEEIDGPPPASDFLDSFHFVSHMLHRATEVSGAIPTETVEDRTAKHEQIEVLAKNKEMNTVIENMRILSKQFEDIVHSVSSHRKELGRSIRQTHTTYVRLFERMLFVVLKLQRKRDKKNEREVQGYRDQISQLVLQNDLLQAQLLKLGHQNSALVGVNQSLHVDNDRLIEENAKLDKYFKLYHEMSQEMKKNAVKMVMEREELKQQLAAEEQAMTERFRLAEEQWAEERKKMLDELKASKRKPAVITKPAVPVGPPKKQRTFKKKIVEIKPIVEKGPVERADGFCQTEVNDDGLWQKQDGWIINVDEDVLARALWRRALRFVGCPCCKGAGEFLQNVVEEFKNPHKKLQIKDEGDSDEDEDDMVNEDISKKTPKRRGRRSGADSSWMLPDELVEFLSNLPKTVQGARPKPLAWLCKEINSIFSEKFEADRQDENEGQQTQAMNDFLMELFLKRYGLRRLAELNLYVFIITIKEYYEMNSLVHTIARFMNLMDEPNKKEKGAAEGGGGGREENHDIVPSNKMLDTSFLTAFLWTREKLLSDYHGVYVFGADERRNGGRGSMEGLPTHCIVQRGCDFFVPLDRIVYMVKLVLNFLTPRKLATYSRQIEKRCQVLRKDGKVEKGEGARMIIRSKMRDSMLKVTPGKSIHQHKVVEEDEADMAEDKDDVQIVVDIYQTLQMMMEILNLRVHHMEDQLKRYFIEGDDNGDGVLSFEEFDALLKRIAPTFSDRRILRMFRQALCSGPDSSFAIEKSTFADVCKNHGLVKLIDSKELEEIHEEEQQKAKHHKERLERIKEERSGVMKKLASVEEGGEEEV
ncbi:hypothetical protein TL16_g00386 [Triparma laevis f. inornata]|uniref:EF-hand domain-containing protein n=1 Tax=Triparma laevis f. inornata TaxID=1714386 RepID=A0A9W6ZCZ5_9STRA|nr:hypothetical protein TL16_g00386 [Triparma laevis f. inornata]